MPHAQDEVAPAFGREAPPHVLLVVDEAYLDFLDEPLDLLPLVRAGTRPNLLLARTFSKIYGLAGLRLGYGLGHPGFIEALEKVRQPFNINSLAQVAALAALDDESHRRRTKANNRAGLRFFERAFRDLRLEFIPSAANFILVRVGDGQRVFGELQKQGIIVRPMAGYELPEWIRISVGTPAENARCVAALRALTFLEVHAPAPRHRGATDRSLLFTAPPVY
jgi:histidinol-phosphate aminotransferase